MQHVRASRCQAFLQPPHAIDIGVGPLQLRVQRSAGAAVGMDRIVGGPGDPVRRFAQQPQALRRPQLTMELSVEVRAKLGDQRSGMLDERDIEDGGSRPSGGV